MKKIATYQYVLWKSMSSLTYYQDVVKTRFRFSFKFYWAFSMMLGILLSISILAGIFPSINSFATNFSSKANQMYPKDLAVTVKNGEITTNVTEPFSIPLPADLQGNLSNQFKYILTIDSKAKTDDFRSLQSLILVTKNSLIFADRDTSLRVIPLSELGEFTLDRANFAAFVGKITPFIKWLPVFFILAVVFIFLILLPVVKLIGHLGLSLILLILAKVMKIHLGFKKIYQIGLHALVLPTLIQLLMVSFGMAVPIPFFDSIVFLLYALVILASFNEANNSPVTQLKKLS